MKLLATTLFSLFMATSAMAAECPGNRVDAQTIFSRAPDSSVLIFKLDPAKSADIRNALSQAYKASFDEGDFYMVNFPTDPTTGGMLLVKSDGCTDERLPLTISYIDLGALFELAGIKDTDITPYVSGTPM